MNITFLNQTDSPSWRHYKPLLKPLLETTLRRVGHDAQVAVAVVLVNDEAMQAYNKAFRNIDRSTDVLSFPDGSREADQVLLGDIIISVDALRRQAKDYGHSLKREFSFLAVHGFLHLLGYDHHSPEEERAMFGLQKEILNELNLSRD